MFVKVMLSPAPCNLPLALISPEAVIFPPKVNLFCVFVIDNLLLEFGYNKMNSNDYITDGIDERINIKLNNYFKLFSKVMTVYTSFTVSGFLDRDNDYVLHPIDQYPIKIDTDNLLKDIWLMITIGLILMWM